MLTSGLRGSCCSFLRSLCGALSIIVFLFVLFLFSIVFSVLLHLAAADFLFGIFNFLSAKYIYNNHPLSIVREDMAEWLSMKRALVEVYATSF